MKIRVEHRVKTSHRRRRQFARRRNPISGETCSRYWKIVPSTRPLLVDMQKSCPRYDDIVRARRRMRSARSFKSGGNGYIIGLKAAMTSSIPPKKNNLVCESDPQTEAKIVVALRAGGCNLCSSLVTDRHAPRSGGSGERLSCPGVL